MQTYHKARHNSRFYQRDETAATPIIRYELAQDEVAEKRLSAQTARDGRLALRKFSWEEGK